MLARLDCVCKTYSWHTHTHTHRALCESLLPARLFIPFFYSSYLSVSLTPSLLLYLIVILHYPPLPSPPLFLFNAWSDISQVCRCAWEYFSDQFHWYWHLVVRATKVSRPECRFLCLPSQVTKHIINLLISVINVITVDRRRMCSRCHVFSIVVVFCFVFINHRRHESLLMHSASAIYRVGQKITPSEAFPAADCFKVKFTHLLYVLVYDRSQKFI